MKKIDFIYPFTGWIGLDLPNCFASLHMFMQKIEGNDEYECKAKNGQKCDGCGNCKNTLRGQHERFWFTFDTVSGRTATITGWENTNTDIFNEVYNTDDSLDFLMGYNGYSYEKYTDKSVFNKKIIETIDKNTPVLVRTKIDENIAYPQQNEFSIIIGYDDEKFIIPDTINPKIELNIENIEQIYIITDKIKQKYNNIDVLKRLKHIMETNRKNGEWDKYIDAFSKYWDKSQNLDIEQLKQKFWFLHRGMIWNCHNFSEASGIWDELKKFEKFKPALDRMFVACDLSHTHQWQGMSLWTTRDWSKKFYNEVEWGMFENAIQVLKLVKEDDEVIYQSIYEILAINN